MRAINYAILFVSFIVMTGCAIVPMEIAEKNLMAKQFNPPSEGSAGLYIYRNSFVGKALKKDIWVDGKCIGETAPDIYSYATVDGDTNHKVSTESEFSPNDILIKVKSGMNYFIRQYIKMGIFVGGAGLELVDEGKGKEEFSELDMATKGTCNNKAS